MKRQGFQFTLLIFTFASLILLVGIQITWIIRAARMQETQFNHSVTMAMNRIVENLAHEKEICQEVSNCLRAGNAGSCYFLMKNREEWKNIKSVIENDLKYYGINLDFEFDIIDVNHEETDLPRGIYLSGNLEEILEQSGFSLSIRFPEKRDFLMAQIGNIFIFSIILLILVTLSFILIYRYYRKGNQLTESIIDFVNNMTHEFKTPLTNIALANSMLSKNESVEGNEKLSFYTDVIKSEHSKLKEKVEKLLKTSFTDTEIPSFSELIEASAVIDNLTETFEVQINQKGGSVTVNRSGEQFEILGNLDLFHIAMGNLIDNSIKYGGDPPEINITLRSSVNLLMIDIEDNGPGIPGNYLNMIFDKYFRVPAGNIHDIEGFGLGLYHVRNIVEKMGGKIRASNLKGKGLRISVELPLAQVK